MTDAEVRAALTSQQTLALTGWAEARRPPRGIPSDHSPVEELIAVMVVVRNRLARFARWRATDASYKAVCLAPRQFSCWNVGTDRNHVALMTLARLLVDPTPTDPRIDPVFYECSFLSGGVIAGALLDRTGGADSYFAPAAMIPVGRIPDGAQGRPLTLIGDQYFYEAA